MEYRDALSSCCRSPIAEYADGDGQRALSGYETQEQILLSGKAQEIDGSFVIDPHVTPLPTDNRINGTSVRAYHVRAETRDRVWRVVDELGCAPSITAAALRTDRGYTITLIISDITNSIPKSRAAVSSLLRRGDTPSFRQ